jgi:hypothetical protein
MSELEQQIETIKSKDDFLVFMDALLRNYRSAPQTWENRSLDDYLDAIARWVESIEWYYKNNEIKDVDLASMNWRVMADILMAAKLYE